MQTPDEQAVANGRLRALSRNGVSHLIFLGASLTLICTLAIVLQAYLTTSGTGVLALPNDHRVFWAAGQIALEGDFLGVFDTGRLTGIHNVDPQVWMPWLYPPGFLFLIAPLGAVSFATSYTVFVLISIGLMALAVRRFAAGSWAVWLAFTLAPAYLPILIQGQNGLIWLAGLVAALAALRDERWVLAGVFIGLLTLKPQYGVLIPLALLAAGLWRTILSATATALIVAAVPTFWTGLDFWALLFKRMGEYSDRIRDEMPALDLAAGPFSMFVRLGVDPETAQLFQFGVTLAMALCVFVVWRSSRASFDTKAACLIAASLLASPVVWYNEAASMALVGLFLLRAGLLRQKPLHGALLAVLWLGAGPQAFAIFLGLGDIRFPWAFLVTPVMLLCLALCLMQARPTRASLAARR
jgi:arabinofuranan 3-O-arabinosyltransferase